MSDENWDYKIEPLTEEEKAFCDEWVMPPSDSTFGIKKEFEKMVVVMEGGLGIPADMLRAKGEPVTAVSAGHKEFDLKEFIKKTENMVKDKK